MATAFPTLQVLAQRKVNNLVGAEIYAFHGIEGFDNFKPGELWDLLTERVKNRRPFTNISGTIQASEITRTSSGRHVCLLKRDDDPGHICPRILSHIKTMDTNVVRVRFDHVEIPSFWLEAVLMYHLPQKIFKISQCRGRIEDFTGNLNQLRQLKKLSSGLWSDGTSYIQSTRASADVNYNFGALDTSAIITNPFGNLNQCTVGSFDVDDQTIQFIFRDSHCPNFKLFFDLSLNQLTPPE